MIIVQLKGGLGNQLFQYAAGLSLARHHGVDLKVDVSELRAPDETIGTMRHYELQHLVGAPEIATADEVSAVTSEGVISNYLQKLLPSYKRTVYNEKQFEYDKHFFDAGAHIYLKGYRQSERYFKPIEGEIKSKFKLKDELISRVKEPGARLREENSVSIHIRRGDYTNKTVLEHHGILPADYYQKAVGTIQRMSNKPVFYVFSDNVNWVKDNLHFGADVHFVSGELSKTAYEDFYLMSSCKNNIIANSSFSWWAAWVNDNPKKVVVAPTTWFNKAELNIKDLIPEGWMKV